MRGELVHRLASCEVNSYQDWSGIDQTSGACQNAALWNRKVATV